MALVNAAAILEKADESLLPAVYKELSVALSASPAQLGALTFVRAIVQAVFSPLAGTLALRYPRPLVIGAGTVFWALSTAAVALSSTFAQCAFWRGVNGIGLAIVIPATQSFVADSHAESGRGVAFGWLSLVGTLGSISGGMAATMAAGQDRIWGIPGWRFAFLTMAFVSSLVGYSVLQLVRDPRDGDHPQQLSRSSSRSMSWWRDSQLAIGSIAKVHTFQIIVLQGIVGSLPWTAMVFFTLWFQLIGKSTRPEHPLQVLLLLLLFAAGFGHSGAAFLTGIFSLGTALGALTGGWIGDAAARRFPKSGRIMCAQLSSFLGVPFSFLLLQVLPQEPKAWPLLALTLAAMGLSVSWNSSCANNPMFAEVVPAKHRTMVYAIDRALEGGLSALAAPAVGLIAESHSSESSSSSRALSKGLLAMTAIPFGLCCLCYTPLYFTYNRDKRKLISSGRSSSYQELRTVERLA